MGADVWSRIVDFLIDPKVAGVSGALGTIASVLGLAFTLWVWLSVRSLRAQFMFAARAPQIIEELKENASALSKAMNEYEASIELIDVELAKCHANLKNLRPKVRSATRKTIVSVIGKTEKYLGGVKSKPFAREIYTNLNGLIQELKNLQEDMKWSETNAGG